MLDLIKIKFFQLVDFCYCALFAIMLVAFLFFPVEQQLLAKEYSSSITKNVVNHNLTLQKLNHTWQAYQLPPQQKLRSRPLGQMPLTTDNQAAIPSNANNFHAALSAGVDARTGNVSVSMTLAHFLYDYGKSMRSLVLFYHGGYQAGGDDLLGLGPHWGFDVGLETPSNYMIKGHQTTSISDSEGNSFTMINKNGKWQLYRHKMHDVKIVGHPGDWTISESQGVRFHILNGYEDWEEMRDGSRVWLYYDRQGNADIKRHLLYICSKPLNPEDINKKFNVCPKGIRITYDDGNIIINGKQKIILHQQNIAGFSTINFIEMPSLTTNSNSISLLKLKYESSTKYPWLLSRIIRPDGSQTIFKYNGESDYNIYHNDGLPVGMNGAKIPVVTEKIVQASPEYKKQVPDKYTWYRYSADMNDQHNFSGYQRGVSMIPGMDNLMDRPDNYFYTVQQDDGITTTSTKYNKYHLAMSVTQTNDHFKTTVAKELNQYPQWEGTVFDQLPPQYSKAQQKTDISYPILDDVNNNIQPTTVINQKKYNDNGMVIWEKDSYGRQRFTQYCPPQGDANCPVADDNWPTIGLPEKVIELPARNNLLGSTLSAIATEKFTPERESDPAIEIEYHYIKVPQEERLVNKVHQYATILHKNYQGLLTDLPQNIGIDNSPNAGKISVNSRIVGYLSANQEMNLKPGINLPDLSPENIKNKMTFKYDLNQINPTYGEMTGLTIQRFVKPEPFINLINNRLLNLRSVKNGDSGYVPDEASFDVIKKINYADDTKIICTRIDPNTSVKDIKGANALLKSQNLLGDGGGGIFLGTKIISLQDGSLVSSTDTMKEINNSWKYDSWGRPLLETITSNRDGKNKFIKWQYIENSGQNSVIKIYPDGNRERNDFVNLGQNQVPINVWFSPAHSSNWIKESSYTYNDNGQLASKTVYHAADNDGKTIALTTTFGYDLLNRRVWTKFSNGEIVFNLRNDPELLDVNYSVLPSDPSNNLPAKVGTSFQVSRLNLLGKPVAVYIFATDPNVKLNGKFEYSDDLRSALLKLEHTLRSPTTLNVNNSYGLLPVGGNGLFSFIDNAIKQQAWLSRKVMTYDGQGKLVQITSPSGLHINYIWKNGNRIATEMADGTLIHETYNLFGSVVSRCVQPKNSNFCHVLSRSHYDGSGLTDWNMDESGNRHLFTYDLNGKILTTRTVDLEGNKLGADITYVYNGYGRIVKLLVDGQVNSMFTYNSDTWQLTDFEDHISHLHYYYDDSGRIIKIVRSLPKTLKSLMKINPLVGIQTFHYDRFSKIISTTNMEGYTFFQRHDNAGRIIASYVILPKQTRPTLLSKTKWNTVFNRIESIQNGNGMIRKYTYNNCGNITGITDSLNNKILMQFTYKYDMLTGNIISYTRSENNHSATEEFIYKPSEDSLVGMICHATGKTLDTTDLLCPRDTDLEGSDLTQKPIIMSQKYQFDNWNNISLVTEKLLTTKGIITKTVHYAYKSASNLSLDDHYDPHRMIAYGVQWQNNNFKMKTINYNQLGEVTKDANGNILKYNNLGEMTEFINVNNHNRTVYTYDSMGHQIAMQLFDAQGKVLQSPLYMLYENNNLTAQYQEDDNHHMHIVVPLQTARSVDGKITEWYEKNSNQDILSSRDSAGNLLSENVYSPYGMEYNILHDSSTHKLGKLWINIHKPSFDGQMFDPSTDYQFLGGGYRAYNPIYRRFMSHDSLSPLTTTDGYGFVDNNPIMKIDPSGHFAQDTAGTVIGVLAGAATIFMSIAMAVLCPFAAVSALTTTASIAAWNALSIGTSLLGAADGVVGAVSGSLNIAATFVDHDDLQRTAFGFGMASGFLGLMTGGVITTGGVFGVLTGVSKLSSVLILGSGISAVVSAGTSTASQALQNPCMNDDLNISDDTGAYLASEILGGIGAVLGFVAMGLGAGATISTAIFDVSANARFREGRFRYYSLTKQLESSTWNENFRRLAINTKGVGIGAEGEKPQFQINALRKMPVEEVDQLIASELPEKYTLASYAAKTKAHTDVLLHINRGGVAEPQGLNKVQNMSILAENDMIGPDALMYIYRSAPEGDVGNDIKWKVIHNKKFGKINLGTIIGELADGPVKDAASAQYIKLFGGPVEIPVIPRADTAPNYGTFVW